jgi:serine/threonine protein kinase
LNRSAVFLVALPIMLAVPTPLWRLGRIDHRADIYSLGVVLYELLTGELPSANLQPPSRRVQIDVRLDEIVLRALEAEPERRFQTAGEFRTQIETVTAAPASTAAPAAFDTVMESRFSMNWRTCAAVTTPFSISSSFSAMLRI